MDARNASGSSSVVEHFLAKEDVGGSNPLSRSNRQTKSTACPILSAIQDEVSMLTCPVKAEIAGSNPVGVARQTFFLTLF